LVVLEALSCGLPVITSRFNGVSELMQDPKHGRILDDPSDVSALAECMESLCDPMIRKPIALRARELAMNHSFARQAQEFLDLYAEIVRNNSRPGR
jgi:UDP-glucose:(heptosyl)LPS alpha-1,3-glucosyltransferase